MSTATPPATTRKTNPPGKKGRPSGQRENSSLTDGGLRINSVLQASSTQPLQRVKAVGLLLDVKTRWNSSYSMLQRFYDLQFAVTMFLNRVGQSGDNSMEKFRLSDFELEQLKHILELLKPLYVATVNLSKSKFSSLSTTLPVYMGMIKV